MTAESRQTRNAKTALCYCTDRGYLLPAIVSANSVIENSSTDNIDIFIFTIDISEEDIACVRAAPACAQMTFIPIAREWEGAYDESLYDHRLPNSALGRLYIHKHIGPEYERVLYLDGDTFVFGDLSPLLQFDLPPGHVGAVHDAIKFSQHNLGQYGAYVRNYFKTMGLPDDEPYFNSGVMVCHRDTWQTICEDAEHYFMNNIEKCLNHDQTALNVAAKGRKIPLSLKWNSLNVYMARGLDKHVKTVVRHYTGWSKPWLTPEGVDMEYKAVYNRIRNSIPIFISNTKTKTYEVPVLSIQSKMFTLLMSPVWHAIFYKYEKGVAV